jgi:hypothetical protein
MFFILFHSEPNPYGLVAVSLSPRRALIKQSHIHRKSVEVYNKLKKPSIETNGTAKKNIPDFQKFFREAANVVSRPPIVT